MKRKEKESPMKRTLLILVTTLFTIGMSSSILAHQTGGHHSGPCTIGRFITQTGTTVTIRHTGRIMAMPTGRHSVFTATSMIRITTRRARTAMDIR
jgi:hypothetical protein